MAFKKTIKIADLQRYVNHKLEHNGLTKEAKISLCLMLETFQRECNVYAGFSGDTFTDAMNKDTFNREYYLDHKLRD